MKGAVVAPQPRACEIGACVLEAGGNAFDAAIATAFAQEIDDPFMCGIGGMGTAHVVTADGRHEVIDFQARAGSRCTPTMYLRNTRGRAAFGRATLHNDYSSELGYRSIMVPGTVAGLAELHARHGTRPWADLVRPAAALARSGTWVMPHLVEFLTRRPQPGLADGRARVSATEESRNLYLRADGTLHDVGDMIPNPGLADTLEMIAREGGRSFYDGVLGARIADDLEKHDAWITKDDLRGFAPRPQESVSITYRGITVATAPPPCGGIMVLAILKILEAFDLRAMAHGSAAHLGVLARALIEGQAGRYDLVGDPFFVPFSAETVLGADRIDPAVTRIRGAATHDVAAPPREHGTTHVCVMDAAGNVVSLTHTLATASGVITPGLGFMYNNSMKLFDPDPDHPNGIRPGKARGTAMSPSILFRNGRPWMAVGAPGGSAIISSVAQTISNVIDFGMSAAEAVAAPRIHAEGSAVQAEARVSARVVDALRASGLAVEHRPYSYDPSFSRAQCLIADAGTWSGGSDPRTGSGGFAVA
ncbi:gamma-glutamyltransferase [Elioraea sp.]|uniref:gamma-glutamyltransferase n=1 Tax=Elioraea sp. TaxID=2185103 RepID=UPI0025BB4711|nr:gamma-glutamyltransferase [Elioraea sp.]